MLSPQLLHLLRVSARSLQETDLAVFRRRPFLAHRLGTDHAEGITTLDMNGDGRVDLLSGSYWYENPGPLGGEWKRHQYRTVGIHNEFVSDCGEWTFDVNHDGALDVVTTGWIANGPLVV